MRESNFSDATHNIAALVLAERFYERRALDTTSPQPLLLSLNRLHNLIAHVPRIKDVLAVDGGLERLVAILKEARPDPTSHRRSTIIRSLAFQCILAIGIRGTEALRTRVVEADMTAVIASTLQNFMIAFEYFTFAAERQKLQPMLVDSIGSDNPIPQIASDTRILGNTLPSNLRFSNLQNSSSGSTIDEIAAVAAAAVAATENPSELRRLHAIQTNESTMNRLSDQADVIQMAIDQVDSDSPIQTQQVMSSDDEMGLESSQQLSMPQEQQHQQQQQQQQHQIPLSTHQAPIRVQCPISSQQHQQSHPTPTEIYALISQRTYPEDLVARMGDVILSLQLLAYLSKYTKLKPYFQECYLLPELMPLHFSSLGCDADFEAEAERLTKQPINVFVIVEKFTQKVHPEEVQTWASVIMRNGCRRDESRGGVRQCAYHGCQKWEDSPRQFAKCRRCKRTKYCSKDCQSKAWTGKFPPPLVMI